MLCSHLILPSNFRLTQIDGKHFSKNHPYFNACKEQVPRARPGYYDLRLTRHGKMVGCMAPISLGCPESDRCCKNDTTELIRWNTHTHVDIIHISYIYHIYIYMCVCVWDFDQKHWCDWTFVWLNPFAPGPSWDGVLVSRDAKWNFRNLLQQEAPLVGLRPKTRGFGLASWCKL